MLRAQVPIGRYENFIGRVAQGFELGGAPFRVWSYKGCGFLTLFFLV
jgi:hypothetical protein